MAPATTTESPIENQPGQRQFQVVIVDDDAGVLMTMERFVKALGHEAIALDNFEEARAFIGSNAPDAIIVDIRLGTYNGLQLVHLSRQLHPQARIIAVSGFDDAVLRDEAARAGASFLIKPFKISDLEQALSALSGPATV